MDNIDEKLEELANSSAEINPIEMWMRGVISERASKRNDAGAGDLENVSEEDIDAIIGILDSYSKSEGNRMKIDVVEGDGGIVDKKYHHGRCDVCSPFANGDAWDVLEDPQEENERLEGMDRAIDNLKIGEVSPAVDLSDFCE